MSDRRPVRVVPTPLLLWAMVPACGLALLALIVPGAMVFWLAWTALLLLLAVVDLVTRVRADAFAVERDVPPAPVVARDLPWAVTLRYVGPGAMDVRWREVLPPDLQSTDDPQSVRLANGAAERFERTVLPLARGTFAVPPVTLRVSRPWGLVARQFDCGPTASVTVLPGRPEGEIGALLKRLAATDLVGENPTRRRGEDWEFDSLREYVVGDDLRMIDWKATARRCNMIVRQFRLERDAEVVLALDCGRLMGGLVNGVRKVDLAMTPVLDLAAAALRRGDRVGLVAFDSRVRAALPARSGLSQLNGLRTVLAGLSAEFDQTLYRSLVQHLERRHRKRALVVVFTDFADELSSSEMAGALASLASRHVILFVGVNDPHLDEIIDERPIDPDRVYQKMVAAELMTERSRVLSSMQRAGALVVDADPTTLSAKVLNRYLEGVRSL